MKKEKAATFPVLFPNAAGIDIGSKEHYVAVRPDIDDNPVRSFGSFTVDLLSICEWLSKCQVTTVAMEATGIYWVSLYLLLEESGFEVVLVNARHVKNVRGKKQMYLMRIGFGSCTAADYCLPVSNLTPLPEN